MNKYIIRNCPCYNKDYSCQSKDNITGKFCQDCTNCLLKQIVELCNRIISLNNTTDFIDIDMYKHAVAVGFVARYILQLLDIQEVE